MLSLLRIENIAVVEKADIEFGSGLNILTGETGAGKSIIIDSISAVLGGRVTRDLVRTGADKASVTAVFVDAGADEWCEENGIEIEDELVLMRKINADGKSSCRVNGNPVSAAQLKSLGEGLLNIHGQNDGQRLLSEQNHLSYLDSFADIERERTEYIHAFSKYSEIKAELEKHVMDDGEKARRTDVLTFQIEELEDAELEPGEADELSDRGDLLRNAEKLSDAVSTAFYALHGDEDGSQGAIDMIGEAESNINYAYGYSSEFKELSSSIEALKYSADDIAEQLRDFRERLDFSPEDLDYIEERLSLINRLMRKYGGDEEELLDKIKEYKEELDSITYSEERIEKLEKSLAESKAETVKAGKKLTAARKKAGEKLEKRIIKELEELNMKGIRFAVQVSEKEAFDRTGMDQIRFLMSANAGEKLGRISKIASGGELARIMLAMKNVLAESERIGTMVFDEIDTGVSGIAAQRVGEKLANLASIRQVLCVTHLPQIAAMADIHFCINKNAQDGRTFTDIMELDREGRKSEIARLTGGEHVTQVTLNSAAELLDSADEYKKGLQVTANKKD